MAQLKETKINGNLILSEGSKIYIGDEEFTGGEGGSNLSFDSPIFTSSISMGRVENSEVGENSTALGTDVMALGEGSVAFGKDSAAGCKGYYISAIDFANHIIYLSKTEVTSISTTSFPEIDETFDSPAYEVGEKFNVVGGGIAHWAPAGTIKIINYNTITFNDDDTLNHNFTIDNIEANKSYIFFTPLHPNIGEIEASSFGFTTGAENYAIGAYSVAEGYQNISLGDYSHTEGRLNIAGFAAHAEGLQSEALGIRSHAEGTSKALEGYSHSEGRETVAKGIAAHAEGYSTEANKEYSHAEGRDTVANNTAAHAEGYLSEASGMYSHAEGEGCKALLSHAHAEGRKTEAKSYAHAEGNTTKAHGQMSHTEGGWTKANGICAHAEGQSTLADKDNSHAEGWDTQALGIASHAEGHGTITTIQGQHAQGRYNEEDTDGNYAHIVGWGTSNSARKNIHTVDIDGNPWFAGNVISFGGTADAPRIKLEYDATNGFLSISVE